MRIHYTNWKGERSSRTIWAQCVETESYRLYVHCVRARNPVLYLLQQLQFLTVWGCLASFSSNLQHALLQGFTAPSVGHLEALKEVTPLTAGSQGPLNKDLYTEHYLNSGHACSCSTMFAYFTKPAKAIRKSFSLGVVHATSKAVSKHDQKRIKHAQKGARRA